MATRAATRSCRSVKTSTISECNIHVDEVSGVYGCIVGVSVVNVARITSEPPLLQETPRWSFVRHMRSAVGREGVTIDALPRFALVTRRRTTARPRVIARQLAANFDEPRAVVEVMLIVCVTLLAS